MIMMGARDATLVQVQRVDIHGTRLLDLLYAHDEEPGTLRRARLGPEAVYTDPQPGDQVQVSYVMGVATDVRQR